MLRVAINQDGDNFDCPSRAFSAAMILQSIYDYNAYLRLKARKGGRCRRSELNSKEREVVRAAERAWNWVEKDPMWPPVPGRITFEKCCEALDWSPDDLRSRWLSREVRENLSKTKAMPYYTKVKGS